jgi:hypothetical protein
MIVTLTGGVDEASVLEAHRPESGMLDREELWDAGVEQHLHGHLHAVHAVREPARDVLGDGGVVDVGADRRIDGWRRTCRHALHGGRRA